MAFDKAGAVDFAKKNRLAVKEDGLTDKSPETVDAKLNLLAVKPAEKIRSLTVAEGPSAVGFDIKAQVLTVKKTGGTPIYYLPWIEDGGYRITLSPENNVDPDIFLTAGLNGCEVFVEGDPKTPTVYHFNAKSTGGSLAELEMPRDAAQLESVTKQKIMEMENRFKIARGTQKIYKAAPGKGRAVNALHYMGPVSFKKEYEQHVSKVVSRFKCPKDPIKFTEGQSAGKTENPINFLAWATVFGVKQKDATWKFYLQPRWAVTYMTLKPKTTGAKKGDYDIKTDWADLQPPIEFYPNGPGGIAI